MLKNKAEEISVLMFANSVCIRVANGVGESEHKFRKLFIRAFFSHLYTQYMHCRQH